MPASQPPGFLAVPSSGTGAGVLVLHAWWGLNETIKDVCTRLADEGFVAFAPDLYHGEVADTIAGAEAMVKALNSNYLQAKAEVDEAARFLSERAARPDDGLGVIGFSLGAYYALELANDAPDLIRAVVLFYGTGEDDFRTSQAAYLGHFGEDDSYEPQDVVDQLEDALKRAGRPATIHRYPGAGHWFFEPDRSDAYDEDAAILAWERTLEFLRESLSPQSG